MTAVESFGAFGFSPDWLQNELLAADAEIEETILRERKKKLT
jgi:hypothetical protein